jgi:hypothetical protein
MVDQSQSEGIRRAVQEILARETNGVVERQSELAWTD